VTLDKTSASLMEGESLKLKVTLPSNTYSRITWTSSDNSVAVVSAAGKVRAVGEGKCTVSAKVSGGKTLKCSVTVTGPAELSRSSLTLSAVDRATLRLTGASGKKVTWSSSKSSVAKITKRSSGSATIAGVKPGTAVIKAKIAGGTMLKCTVKVVAPLKMTTAKLVNESGKRMLYAKFANRSDKKITYVRCDILQYDSRNQRLKSPYDSFDLTATIKAHAATTKSVDVNGQTDRVTYRIIEVRFSDGTTWKP